MKHKSKGTRQLSKLITENSVQGQPNLTFGRPKLGSHNRKLMKVSQIANNVKLLTYLIFGNISSSTIKIYIQSTEVKEASAESETKD